MIAVDKDENVYLEQRARSTDNAELIRRLEDAMLRANAEGKPLPEVHIRGDKDVRFEAVGRVVLRCPAGGVPKVGFLTEPQNHTGILIGVHQ